MKHNPEILYAYKNCKSRYDAALSSSKQNFYSSIIKDAQNESKVVWNVIRAVNNKSRLPGNNGGFTLGAVGASAQGGKIWKVRNNFLYNIKKIGAAFSSVPQGGTNINPALPGKRLPSGYIDSSAKRSQLAD
ncbi:hypothetical protein WA026_006863 [Henosepilachna vigintioctopunctata]|uniref:Uncharacterized protein n=1 Tax=Henosepilachna vigintioctopunctata TaxID=420089 RepID=A0AAW1UGK5_9CUCU